jgi:hypothetical protein
MTPVVELVETTMSAQLYVISTGSITGTIP